MKKRLCTLLLALIMLGSLFVGALPAVSATAAEATITLRLHYHREDGDYENWHRLWLWDASAAATTKFDDTKGYEFKNVNGEMICEVSVNPGTMQIGYIVFRSSETKMWEEKDIDADQFIDIAGVIAGTIDVYIESRVKGHKMVDGEGVIRDTVIVSAYYKPKNSDGLPQVIVQMSNPIRDYEVTVDTFCVFNRDYTAKITAVKEVNNYYYLTLSQQLDTMSSYSLTFEDKKAGVTMPDVYSTEEFENRFTYLGDDLGFTYTPEKTFLRVWIPLAERVVLKLYSDGDPEKVAEPTSKVEMTKDVKGTWVCELQGNMEGTYYTYEAIYAANVVEASDPYSRSTGVNGYRSMIFDLDATDPEGWENDRNPQAGKKITDAAIYELHVRDMSADASSGIVNKGKYLAFLETDTHNENGIPTGLAHIKDLGMTHVHLLPVYDFGSIDETESEEERGFNWGYDPMTYNVPEGSYSTDPTDGRVRVKEFKLMVQSMHDNGLGVIMDVVYNHVYNSSKFNMNVLVPGYFVRAGSKGCGVGEDVASERTMVKKFIVDSVNYWADEYHIDGFRFDLMGILDTETMNEIVSTVHEKHPDVIFYGEGWQLPTKVTKPGYSLATQANSSKMPEIAHFNDFFRNLIKGGTYGGVSAGWISGGNASTSDLNDCFMGTNSWCKSPTQTINYTSAHDNNTLFDHITLVAKNASFEERVAMNKLAAAFCYTAVGTPFMQAGEEMLRSKPDGKGGFVDDSYKSPDSVNALKWDDLNNEVYMNVYNYYKGLIAFRMAHPALRLSTAEEVNANITPVSGLPNSVVAYNIKGGQENETADAIFCAFNGSQSAVNVTLPMGEWEVYVDDQLPGTSPLRTVSGTVELPAHSAVVLAQGIEKEPELPWALILILSATTVTTAAVALALVLKKKK